MSFLIRLEPIVCLLLVLGAAALPAPSQVVRNELIGPASSQAIDSNRDEPVGSSSPQSGKVELTTREPTASTSLSKEAQQVQLEKENMCPICWRQMDESSPGHKTSNCSHKFHYDCLLKWQSHPVSANFDIRMKFEESNT